MIRKPWLLALTVLAVLVWNCSDDDPSGPPIGDPGDTEIDFDPNAGAGSVTGYLYLDSGGFRSGSTVHLIDDPAQAPDGTDPLVKTTVRVEMPDGAVVESGITDAFGRFSFQEIPIGAKQLAVYIEDDDTPDFEFEFSPVPDATTTLGRAHDVTRQEAIAIIESDFTSDDLVLGTLQPLEPGTLIYPAGFIDLENPTVPVSEVTTVDTPSWFFYIDPTFDAMFEHEVRYVLVDAETGATTWRDDVAWPPAINHVPFWNDDEQYFLYENVDPDDFEPDDIPADADFEDTSEVV